MLLAFAAIFYLTWESVANHDWEKAAAQGKIVEEVEFDETAPGYELYQGSSCIGCHGDQFQGGLGLPLTDTGLSPEEIEKIAHDGIGTMPAGQWEGSDEDLATMAEFISNLGKE